MQITITCGTCQKRYKVDAKLGGRRAKCKACGAPMEIPRAEAGAEGEYGLAAEPKAAPRPAPVKGGPAGAPRAMPRGAGKPTATRPGPAAKPVAAARPAAVKPVAKRGAAAAPSGEMDFADPACPQCGRPLPPADRICISCGYDRNPKPAAGGATAGRQLRTIGFMKPAVEGDERDYQGLRVNKPYENQFLGLVDLWVPKVAAYLVVLGILALVGLLWYGTLSSEAASRGEVNYGRLIAISLYILITMGLALLITLGLTGLGAGIGTKIMKCQLPENVWSRLLATYLVPSVFAVVVLVVMGVGAGLLSGRSPNLAVGAIVVAILAALGAFLVSSFFTFLFFFRLKILEALVAYLFVAGFYVLSCIANALVFWLGDKALEFLKI